MHAAPPSQTLAPRKSSRGILIGLAAALLLAAWGVYWFLPRQIPTSGGLYFPSRVLIDGPHFLQGDQRWAKDSLGSTPDPLRDVGCAVASAAMALSSLGIATDPGALNAFLQKTEGGYTPEGWIYWEKAAEIDPAKTNQLLPHYEDLPSFFLMDWNLLRGNPVIARVRYPSGITHFVLVCGKEGFDYLVRDPGEGGAAGITRLSDFPGPVEALRFYQKPGAPLDGGTGGN
jgi:hypothetical protein